MTRRIDFLDVEFDSIDFDGACAWLAGRTTGDGFAYVVTPNVDHIVRAQRDPDLYAPLYSDADLCLCDSRILALLAKRHGVELPVVPGSDLTPALFDRVLRPGDSVCLVGGAEDAVPRLQARYPGIRMVQHCPPMGLRTDPKARRAAAEFIAGTGARFVLLAVGGPQQEMIAREMKLEGGHRGTALCIGASIDFLTGGQTRAPRIVQKLALEWLWRLGTDPRRLARRYLVEGPAIFAIARRWSRKRRSAAQ